MKKHIRKKLVLMSALLVAFGSGHALADQHGGGKGGMFEKHDTNNDGVIDHVGIIMQNNYVIHSSGKVRIDRIDHTGIFNAELKSYTHKLRVIKKII